MDLNTKQMASTPPEEKLDQKWNKNVNLSRKRCQLMHEYVFKCHNHEDLMKGQLNSEQ